MLDFYIYRSGRKFVLAWMTPPMRAHAFWVFSRESEAVGAAEKMLGLRP